MRKLIVSCVAFLLVVPALGSAGELSALEELGARLFFDPGLSTPPGQSCAECHDPRVGWSGPDSARNAVEAIYPGAVHVRAGNRKPPSSAYSGFNPVLHRCGEAGGMCGGGMGGGGMGGGGMGGGGMGGGGMGGGGMGGGGMGGGGMMMSPDDFVGGTFWDGRATGWVLGDPLAEQAMGPFLNPLEQNNPNAKHVCLKVRRSTYVWLFEAVWGPRSLDCVKDVAGTYERIARSIAAYERSREVNPFSSKFDAFWDAARAARGVPLVQMINMMNWTRFRNLGLDDGELQGLMIFNTKGNCSACHPLTPMSGSGRPLLTDFRYHNLGMPRNPANPFYAMPRRWNPDGGGWVDEGLGGFLASTAGLVDEDGVSRDYTAYAPQNMGKHKTPTLRNVNRRLDAGFVKAYGHNGFFKSLMEIVHFYNCRDVAPGASAACDEPTMKHVLGLPAEVADNVDRVRLGDLGLQPMEGMALVRFLMTLDDGWAPPAN